MKKLSSKIENRLYPHYPNPTFCFRNTKTEKQIRHEISQLDKEISAFLEKEIALKNLIEKRKEEQTKIEHKLTLLFEKKSTLKHTLNAIQADIDLLKERYSQDEQSMQTYRAQQETLKDNYRLNRGPLVTVNTKSVTFIGGKQYAGPYSDGTQKQRISRLGSKIVTLQKGLDELKFEEGKLQATQHEKVNELALLKCEIDRLQDQIEYSHRFIEDHQREHKVLQRQTASLNQKKFRLEREKEQCKFQAEKICRQEASAQVVNSYDTTISTNLGAIPKARSVKLRKQPSHVSCETFCRTVKDFQKEFKFGANQAQTMATNEVVQDVQQLEAAYPKERAYLNWMLRNLLTLKKSRGSVRQYEQVVEAPRSGPLSTLLYQWSGYALCYGLPVVVAALYGMVLLAAWYPVDPTTIEESVLMTQLMFIHRSCENLFLQRYHQDGIISDRSYEGSVHYKEDGFDLATAPLQQLPENCRAYVMCTNGYFSFRGDGNRDVIVPPGSRMVWMTSEPVRMADVAGLECSNDISLGWLAILVVLAVGGLFLCRLGWISGAQRLEKRNHYKAKCEAQHTISSFLGSFCLASSSGAETSETNGFILPKL